MRGAHSDGRRQQAGRCCGFGAEGRSYDKPFLHQQDQAYFYQFTCSELKKSDFPFSGGWPATNYVSITV